MTLVPKFGTKPINMQLTMLYFSNRDPDGLGRKLIVKSQYIFVSIEMYDKLLRAAINIKYTQFLIEQLKHRDFLLLTRVFI